MVNNCLRFFRILPYLLVGLKIYFFSPCTVKAAIAYKVLNLASANIASTTYNLDFQRLACGKFSSSDFELFDKILLCNPGNPILMHLLREKNKHLMLPLVGLNFDLLPSRKFGNNDNLAIFKIKMHHQNPFKVFDKYRSEFDTNFKQSHDGRVNISSGLESNSQSAECISTNNGKDSLKSIIIQGKSSDSIINKNFENANKILDCSTGSSNNLQNLLLIHPKVFNWTSDSICCYTPKGVVFRKIVYDKPVEFINDEAVNNKKQIIEQYNLLLRNIVPQKRIPNPIVYNMNKVNKAPKVIRKNFTKRSEFKIVNVPIKNRDVQRPVLTAKNIIKVSKNHYAVLLQCLTDLKFNLDVARPAAGFLVKIARMHAKIQLLKAMNSTRVYSPNIIASADIKNRGYCT